MKYRVRSTRQAGEDSAAILDWLMSHDAGDPGIRWFLALEAAIASLESMPHGCGHAPDAWEFAYEVRQLLFGRDPHIYRILFTIDGDTVFILHIRHGRRAPLSVQ